VLHLFPSSLSSRNLSRQRRPLGQRLYIFTTPSCGVWILIRQQEIRKASLAKLSALDIELGALDKELAVYGVCDPVKVAQKQRAIALAKEASVRWTGKLFIAPRTQAISLRVWLESATSIAHTRQTIIQSFFHILLANMGLSQARYASSLGSAMNTRILLCAKGRIPQYRGFNSYHFDRTSAVS
jgi:hypothetical protein